MSNDRLRVGIIGIGRMGSYHLDKFLRIPEAHVIGVLDKDSVRAGAVAEPHGLKVFSSLADLLFEVDAVSIAAPTAFHYSMARQALEAQVHVLVEKPIASNLDDAADLVRIAVERNLVLQVGLVERFRFSALAKGVPISSVRFVESHRLSLAPGREGNIDVVADLMIHDLDLVLSLFDQDPCYVSAVGVPVLTPQTDIANVRMEFPCGGVANLTASRVSRTPMRKFRLFSANSYASMDFMGNQIELCWRSEANRIEKRVATVSQLDSLQEQCKEFVRCVQDGTKPTVRGEDGLRALKYADLIARKINERSILPQTAGNLTVEPFLGR